MTREVLALGLLLYKIPHGSYIVKKVAKAPLCLRGFISLTDLRALL